MLNSDNSCNVFYSRRNTHVTFVEKPKFKIISFQNCQHKYQFMFEETKLSGNTLRIGQATLYMEGHLILHLHSTVPLRCDVLLVS